MQPPSILRHTNPRLVARDPLELANARWLSVDAHYRAADVNRFGVASCSIDFFRTFIVVVERLVLRVTAARECVAAASPVPDADIGEFGLPQRSDATSA